METIAELRRKEKIEILPEFQVIQKGRPLRIAVLFSGGPASGGSNVIAGIYDCLMSLNSSSILIGFLGGPSGILEENFKTLSKEAIDEVRNLGGFDLLSTGRTKIQTDEQFAKAKEVIQKLNLDGLIVIGGDDSNTNAYFLHEYLKQNSVTCSIIGVPKTIDGDLKSKEVEISFGFDTACKVYSEMIGNICIDAKSSLKYWHFIKLMGRTASHVTLECALQTFPNIALIGEEIFFNKLTLRQIVSEITDTIEKRSADGKNYGVILIPEGLIEFIPEVSKEIPEDLLNDKDSHGNIQVSKIETEKLLSKMIYDELLRRQSTVKFNPAYHFFGYEGRCGFPSVFDATYCYNLGMNAALLIHEGKSGVISTIKNVSKNVTNWERASVELEGTLNLEKRNDVMKKVMKKALVDLNGPVFKEFQVYREKNKLQDNYKSPGPIQFSGPLKDQITKTLFLEHNQ